MCDRLTHKAGLLHAIALSLILLGSVPILFSQVPRYAWSTSVSSISEDKCEATAVSPEGGIYVGGFHLAPVDLDPGPAVLNSTQYGYYVQKFDSAGNLIWAYPISSVSPSFNRGIGDMEVAANGDLLVVGTFRNGIDFDPGPATLTFTPIGYEDMFLLRISSAGNLVYAKVIGSGDGEAPYDMELDSQGNIIVVGTFDDFMDILPGSGTYNIYGSNHDGFVTKYDSLGNPYWGFAIGGASNEFTNRVSVSDGGDVTIGGAFVGTADFDPSLATFNMTAVGTESAYLARYSKQGQFRWAKQLAGARGNTLQVGEDSLGNIFCAGTFFVSIDLDLGPTTDMYYDHGNGDFFMIKTDTLANRIWSFSVGNSGSQYAIDLGMDASDNLYVALRSDGNVDWDPSFFTNTVAAGAHSALLVKYDAGGNLRWGQEMIATATSFELHHIKVAGEDEILAAGNCSHTITYTPAQHPVSFTSTAQDDGFLVHLLPCVAEYATALDTACSEPYSYNGVAYTAAGTYTQHLYNSIGCDSILTLVLSWAPLVAQVTPSATVFTASPAGAAYQWLDCLQGSQPIPNATGQTYSPTQYGYYAVVVHNGLCVDTSTCHLFEPVGMASPRSFSFDVTPNPTAERIQFLPPPGMDGAISCVLTDFAGREVQRTEVPADSPATARSMDLGALPSGTYLLHLHSGDMHRVAKVVKL